MKTELIILALSLLASCSALVTFFLRAFYEKEFTKALVLKGLSSLCFVTLGLCDYIFGVFSLPKLLILVGLSLGIIGDEILALCQIYPSSDITHFIGGGTFFIIGHLFYMSAMLIMGNINVVALVISFVLMLALSFFYESKNKFYVGDMKISLRLYMSVVILFAAFGIGSFIGQPGIGRALIAIGGILFAVSDNLLFSFKLHDSTRFYRNIILHIAYYLAQMLIALSIALI